MRARLESPRASYATPGFRIGTTRAPTRRRLPVAGGGDGRALQDAGDIDAGDIDAGETSAHRIEGEADPLLVVTEPRRDWPETHRIDAGDIDASTPLSHRSQIAARG